MNKKYYKKPGQHVIDLTDEICSGILIPESSTPGVSDVKSENLNYEKGGLPASKNIWDDLWE